MVKRKILGLDSNSSGFSLLEVLVVIVLIAIVSAFAAPGWLGYLNRQRIGRARGDLVQALQQAQTDARQRNSPRVVSIASNSPPQIEISAPGEDGIIVDLGGDQTETLSLTGGPAAAVPSVTFDFKGQVEDTTVPFVFSVTSSQIQDGGVRCVIVSTLLGNIVQAEGEDCNNTAGLQ
ncbi:MAG: GspH/FimT family pseudopilin [Cyanobacteria bacterium P01_D01_bin.56]